MATMNDDERAQALGQIPQAAQVAKPNSFGDAAAAHTNPGITQINPAAKPGGPGGPIGKSLAGKTMATMPGMPGDAQAAVAQIPQDTYNAPASDGTMNSPMNTELGRNMSNAANALAAMPGASAAIGAGANALGGALGGAAASAAPAVAGLVGGAERAWQGASTMQRLGVAGAGAAGLNTLGGVALASQARGANAAAQPAPAGGQPMQTSLAQPAGTAGANTALQQPPAVAAAQGVAAPVAAVGQQPRAASGEVTRVGNSYSGGNVGGKITVNGQVADGAFSEAPGIATQPAQAAQATPAAPSATALMAQMFGGKRSGDAPAQQIPWSGVIGGDPATANAQRERSDLISSLTTLIPGAKGITAAQRSGLITLLNSERQDATSRANNEASNQAHLQMAGMNNDAAMQRAAVQFASGLLGNQKDLTQTTMREQGANQRSALQTLGTLQAAQTKAAAGKQQLPPAGYRTTADGNLQAIPGGPADPSVSKEGLQQTKDTQDVFSIIDQAKPLMGQATGSYIGNAVDQMARGFGHSTDGAQAAAQLKALQGALVSKMPKMSGPQSDKDVLLYREMAGQIGDPTIPTEQRMAAMKTVEDLNMKYLPVAGDASAYHALQAGSYYKTPDGAVRRKQ